MAEQQIANLGQRAAPLTRVTKDSEEFELLAVNANFDGTSAASAYLPCVEVVSDAGIVVARSVATETVTAGDSAEVTFAPFLGRNGASDGIKFDTLNVGGYLSIETTSTGPDDPQGITLNSGVAEVFVQTFDPTSGFVGAIANAIQLATVSGLVELDLLDDGSAVFGVSTFTLFATSAYTLRGTTCILRLNDNSGKVEVQDGGGNPIFRVNGDGSLQGKTGKALTFNL